LGGFFQLFIDLPLATNAVIRNSRKANAHLGSGSVTLNS
jgi:hypothetical protein